VHFGKGNKSNGKKRGMEEFPPDASRDDIMAAAKELAVVKN